MSNPKNSVLIDIGEIENTCFVVMPFESLFQTQYERVIRPAVEELGLKCVRADEIYSKPNVMSDIWNSIRRARLIIAELTGRNANVFYEIGLAHAIGKPIILLTRNEADVPFDLKSLRYRYYNVDDPFWGENLREAIQSMAKSIIEQSEFSTYLEGITVDIHVAPSLQIPRQKSKRIDTPIDISGMWKATWRATAATVEHSAVTLITQKGESLSATMTITLEQKDTLTVVQEVLTGSIEGMRVALNGVSYTYIKQGTSKVYNLDNFSLTLSSDGKRMEGYSDDKKLKAAATFIKQEHSL